MIDDLIKDLAAILEIPVRKVSFKNVWKKSPPNEAGGKDLELYLEKVRFLPSTTISTS